MAWFVEALADSATRNLYLTFCFAVLVLPMAGLAIWYHTRINRTPGGNDLMKRQHKSNVSGRRKLVHAPRLLEDGLDMAHDIEAGKYGSDARTLQHKVYFVTGLWLLANVVVFGILIYADEQNRPDIAAPSAIGTAPDAAQ